MKFRLLFLVFLNLFFSIKLSAQEIFERLIPWGNDTCSYGIFAKEAKDGNFVVLSTIADFYSDSGFLIEGPLVYGSGLTKISSNGDILWNKLYDTCTPFLGMRPWGYGRFPAVDFFFDTNNRIVLPYTLFLNILECEYPSSNVGAYTLKRSLMQIDNSTGNIINNEVYLEDTLCSVDRIFATALVDDQIKMLFYDDQFDNTFVQTIDESNLEILRKDTISNFSWGDWFDYDEYSNSFVKKSQYGLLFRDMNGNYVDEFINESRDTIYTSRLAFSSNGNYYVAMSSGKNKKDDVSVSALNVFASNGDLLSSKYLQNDRSIDVTITSSNEILLLSRPIFDGVLDTLKPTVIVRKYDLNLNLFASKKYGFPFVIPEQIELASSDRFFVTGTRLKSMDLTYGKEADQIYFMVEAINNLNSVIDGNEQAEIDVFPNPFSNELKIRTSGFGDSLKFELFDVLGRKIFNEIVFNKNIHGLDKFPEGVYFYQLLNSDGHLLKSGKLIKR